VRTALLVASIFTKRRWETRACLGTTLLQVAIGYCRHDGYSRKLQPVRYSGNGLRRLAAYLRLPVARDEEPRVPCSIYVITCITSPAM
jgi:hypothetical protein